MKKSILLNLITFFLITSQLNAVFITADIYRKQVNNKNHYIICYGDFHLYKDTVKEADFVTKSIEQKKYFIDQIKNKKNSGQLAVILVR